MSQRRTLEVWQSVEDLGALKQNDSKLGVSKSFTGPDGRPSFNVVWQTFPLAPRTRVSWEPRYALNFTRQYQPGIRISLESQWQPCRLGETYNLAREGFWEPSSRPGQPDRISVGENKYSPGHIVIGIAGDDGGFKVAWVDQTTLGEGMGGSYMPSEKMKFWYGSPGDTDAGMAISSTGVSAEGDFTQPGRTGQFYLSATFRVGPGMWIVSQDPPPLHPFASVAAPVTEVEVPEGQNKEVEDDCL